MEVLELFDLVGVEDSVLLLVVEVLHELVDEQFLPADVQIEQSLYY